MTVKRITPALFDKLVRLAALELTNEETTYLFEEMNHQLASVETLNQIPIPEDIQPSLHGVEPGGAGLRPDRWQPFQDPERIVALAPESEDGMIAVPDVRGAK